MKKFFLVLAAGACLLLTACDEQQTQLITKYQVVIAPDSMYTCPQIKKWPKIETLTDLQVARTIVQLAEANKICKASLDSIKAYYNNAAKRIEGQPRR